MKRFKSARQAQCFLSAHDQINNLFHLRRDYVTASEYRAARTQAFQIWAEITGVAAWHSRQGAQSGLRISPRPQRHKLPVPAGVPLLPGHDAPLNATDPFSTKQIVQRAAG